jgi:integrase
VRVTASLSLYQDQPEQRQSSRMTRDRLELLTALINGPSFDPLFRTDVIQIPSQHPVYGWECVVRGCQRPRSSSRELCFTHCRQWHDARNAGMGRAEFVRTAEPLEAVDYRRPKVSCRICPDRPAEHSSLRLCHRHRGRWDRYRKAQGRSAADLDTWAANETPGDGFGSCHVVVCPDRADSPLGLCNRHRERYRLAGRPGGASVPARWANQERPGRAVPLWFEDEATFRRWCATIGPTLVLGQVNLLGVRPLLAAEVKWGLFAHTQRQHSHWDLDCVQNMVNFCRQRDLGSLTGLELDECVKFTRMIAREMRNELRLVYYTPTETREAGFIETEHFGVRFHQRLGHLDLTGVSQRWLRDLLWDHLAGLLRSPKCPRSQGPFDQLRRAVVELSAFLEVDAPGGGHDPTLLREEHMQRFVADQQHRERNGLPSLAMKRPDGTPTVVSYVARRMAFNNTRRVLRGAVESGAEQRLGLDRAFITAMPTAGAHRKRVRSPFTDEVARALADQANLRQLQTYDPLNQGLRDIWEAIILTGRRCGEILNLRLDCIGRYGGLAMLWHDQTKVGNYDQAIRIPEHLFELLAERQRKTLARFEGLHGRQPTPAQRARMALFPSRICNPNGQMALSYSWFHRGFKLWIDQLDLGRVVPHQARHTLATNLLRHGATLAHIRRYLGQVSDRMAEHYVHVAHSDLEDVLNHVWVAGPGASNPGELLSSPTMDGTQPMTREQALALAVDLSRRSTPAEGGFCTFQPVVDGGACPWNLDCHNCDKFVLSGADLLYWRRKREQWASIAERAPDDATADYLHQVFEPTAHAIDGLEKALAGLGLLDEALALDLRRPQDYFHRLWSLTFPAGKLADANSAADEPDGEVDPEDGDQGVDNSRGASA